jgi:pimeloyl-ACP methyl ester carboxylesterase
MRTEKLNLRGLQINVQEWGEAGNPKLFMLHGWMDCGASYKYMMPSLADRFHVIAPDLRGFGESEHDLNGYWFPDYFADLEFLLNYYSRVDPVDLVGHSMGGNIALMYAGIRPDRVKRVMSLEGIGLPPSEPSDAVGKYRQWLKQTVANETSKIYPNANLLKHSIYKGNPSLPDHIIEELADLWGKPVGDEGAYMLKHDHRHRNTNPVRYNLDDIREIWSAVTAQTALVMATESMFYKKWGNNGRIDEIMTTLRIAPQNYYEVSNCNHMLHLEQPEATAEVIRKFFV